MFGSAARGTARSDSDVDVGVLLDVDDGLPALRVALERAVGRSVDLVSLRKAPPLLRFEIARDGQLLIERDPHAWVEFRAHAMIDWWDGLQPRRSCTGRCGRGSSERPRVVRRDVVAAKLARARARLNDAASALQSPLETFLSDPKSRDLSLFYLFLAIQECIDLAAHWVADEGWGGPDDAGSAFDPLADRGVIDEDGHGAEGRRRSAEQDCYIVTRSDALSSASRFS